jgi:poly-gamma-glutamate biosynthesis protein PgsC/CapC
MLTAALVVGVLVSLLLTERIGLSPGGIIVPGYVALLLDRPAALIGFLVVALATQGIVMLVGTRLMLFGNRRFAVTILIGLALATGVQWAWPLLDPPFVEWAGLGYIVPGLLAHHFDRQGIWPTLLVLAIAAPVVRIAVALGVRFL